MRQVLVAAGIVAGAFSLGITNPVGAATVGHFEAGQQWTVEVEFNPGQYGTSCAIETGGPNHTLTFDYPFQDGAYRGGNSGLSEHFADTVTKNNFRFHGSWSPSLMQYTGQWRVWGRSGFIAPGNYPGQVVFGAMKSVDGTTC
jgi:hypothetical protein